MAGKRYIPPVRVRSITCNGNPVPPGYVPADSYLQIYVDYLVEHYSSRDIKRRPVRDEMP